ACSDFYRQPTTASVMLTPGSTSTVGLRFVPHNAFSAIVTAEENAVSSATVRIFYSTNGTPRSLLLQTGEDGRAAAADLATWALNGIEVRAPGYERFESMENIPLPADNFVVRIVRNG